MLKALLPITDFEHRDGPRQFTDEELAREREERFLHDYNSDLHEAWMRGYNRGYARGMTSALLHRLSHRFGSIPETLQDRIIALTDTDLLERLIVLSIDSSSLETFEAEIGKSRPKK